MTSPNQPANDPSVPTEGEPISDLPVSEQAAEHVAGGESAATENQTYADLSNVLKTRHDTVKNSIGDR
jgi:hypothetical protein